MENTQKPLFSNCLTTFHWTLPKHIDGFRLSIPKLREDIVFYMSNRFLEAFVKFQTTWQLPCGEYYRNNCFLFVWQASTEHFLKMLMDLDLPYQIKEKHFIPCIKNIYGIICNISDKLTVIAELWNKM